MSAPVVFDLSVLESRVETGVERYARRLVEHLPAAAPDLPFVVLVRPGRAVPAVPPPGRVQEVASVLPRAAWRETAVPRTLARLRARLLHAPMAAVPLRAGVPRIATVHDVPPFGRPGHEGYLSRNRLRLLHASRVATRLIVPSAATRDALAEFAPPARGRIVVIPHGVDPDFRPGGVRLDRERYGIPPGPFILSVGTLRPRKDPLVLIEAFARGPAVAGLNLVLAGELRMEREVLLAPLQGRGLRGRLILPGYVSREDLPDLYREAEIVVLPSSLEGFGLPAVEAMACGRPLIVSGDPALREVVGRAARIFPGGDAAALAAALGELLAAPAERQRLSTLALERAKAFSWLGSARAHAEVYREVLALGHASEEVP